MISLRYAFSMVDGSDIVTDAQDSDADPGSCIDEDLVTLAFKALAENVAHSTLIFVPVDGTTIGIAPQHIVRVDVQVSRVFDGEAAHDR